MNEIEAYIRARPKEIQKKLNQILKIVRKCAPHVNEGLKYGKPALYYKQVLIVFSEFKNHIGFYPTPKVIRKFSIELEKYSTSKGTVRFPLDKPLPHDLIKKMTLYRVQLYHEKNS